MCMVSNIAQPWGQTAPGAHPWIQPVIKPDTPYWLPASNPTSEEFAALKREVEELKKLLVAAKEFDRATGQPDCEMDEKVELIKKIAAIVGVDLGDVFTV